MSSYIKGIYGYIRPGSTGSGDAPAPPISEGSGVNNSPITATTPDIPSTTDTPTTSQQQQQQQQPGYLKWAVSGVASGLYTVGSTSVGVGVTGAKWVAGTTYTVGAGVVGAAGTVVTGTAGAVAGTASKVAGTAGAVAGTVAGTVGSGASSVIAKVTTTKKKEHTD